MIFYGIFGLYALEKFSYSPEEVGVIFMVIGLVSAVTQGGLTGPITRKWGEAPIIKIGMQGSAISFFLMAFADSYWSLLVTIGLFVFMTALLTPAISSLTSKRTETQQGMTMGLSNAFMSLGRIAGPLVAGFVFDLNLILPFVSGAVVMLSGVIASLVWLRGDASASSIGEGAEQTSIS
jgi:DHA1 family multidrug resistance protein-like MFS transporter